MIWIHAKGIRIRGWVLKVKTDESLSMDVYLPMVFLRKKTETAGERNEIIFDLNVWFIKIYVMNGDGNRITRRKIWQNRFQLKQRNY